MKVVLTVDAMFPNFTEFDLDISTSAAGLPDQLTFSLSGSDRVRHLDGSPAESLADLLEAQSVNVGEGRYKRRVEFQDGRLIDPVSGPPVQISALSWVEENIRH